MAKKQYKQLKTKKQSRKLNNITEFPDFIVMQRTSFCWFLGIGLVDELRFFAQILNLTTNVEYVLYGEEFKLLKLPCSLHVARKYNGNYRAQVVIPLEVRNKQTNMTYLNHRFPVITLPLMTTSATFILNGCERVIVSQIIRSPGIYYEKLKKQKPKSFFKRKLSTDFTKLKYFLPVGQASLLKTSFFFSFPKVRYDKDTGKIFFQPRWKSQLVNLLGLNSLKNKKSKCTKNLLNAFKIYNYLKQDKEKIQRIARVLLFINFCKLIFLKKNSEPIKIMEIYCCIVVYYVILLQIIKYGKYLKFSYQSKENQKITKNKLAYSYLLQLFPLKLNFKQIFSKFNTKRKILPFHSFKILKKRNIENEKELEQLKNSKVLQSAINFPITLKNKLLYILKKQIVIKRKGSASFLYNTNRHQYTKSKTRILSFNSEHEITTSYQDKFKNRELYNATLIPENGTWIRFGFQKNLKLNKYNYPVKIQEEDIYIQLDKINQKPIIFLLKENGLNDIEIFNNLEHRDFFYFTKPVLLSSVNSKLPLLRFQLSQKHWGKVSEFSRIFDPLYYYLGPLGRLQINSRLNINISNFYKTITYEDLFAIVDQLITLTISKSLPDDIDHLKNRRVRSIGELLQNLFRIGLQRLGRKARNYPPTIDPYNAINFNFVNNTVKEFFSSSQLSQYLDQTNPLSSLTHRRRISGLGPGGFERDRISFSVRDIHPSHYGRICPIETPEGQNVGLIASLTTCARVNKLGFLETPFWRVINGKVLKNGTPIYLTADIEDKYKIAPADLIVDQNNYLLQPLISVRFRQDFINVSPSYVDFISISPIQIVSVAASLIPFFEHDDANRALMGSNMQRQSVPLILPQKPIVGTGLEHQIAMDSGMTINSRISGTVDLANSTKITIKNKRGRKANYKLQKYLRSNQQTCINHRPIIWKGEQIQSGQILTDGPSISSSELSLGQNILVAYMPWQGYNFEDAILINERLIYEDIFTSIHIERYKIEVDRSNEGTEQTTNDIPNLSITEIENLTNDGIIQVGTYVKPGDILIGKVIKIDTINQLPESKLLRAIFGAKSKGVKDNSYRMPEGDYGRVIETISFNRKTRIAYNIERIYIFIAQIRKIQVGDKIAGRHGNKGIISRILARQDMPFLPDGTPVDIILNPLGVPSRMNVGQLYECLLGLAGDKLNCRFKILPFDEMYGVEMSRILINKKLRQASLFNDQSWLFNPYMPGKMVLIDGRTGKEFENPVTIGNAYILKLIHLVEDKMHSRATGPYSLVTQQPLRGKAQQGGQRFGEMEVWALEGFGAAFTLKEILTIKSDDMQGRNDTLNAIVKGKPIPKFGIPESFKVLLQELRSIGLDISTYKISKFSSQQNFQVEVNIMEHYISLLKTFSPTSNINDIVF